MDWKKDLESYPEHFQKAVRAKLGYTEEPDRQEPIILHTSGIEPIPAQEQIKEYLDAITPPDAHKKRFRFEAFVAGIAFAVFVGGIIVIVLTLLGMGG